MVTVPGGVVRVVVIVGVGIIDTGFVIVVVLLVTVLIGCSVLVTGVNFPRSARIVESCSVAADGVSILGALLSGAVKFPNPFPLF